MKFTIKMYRGLSKGYQINREMTAWLKQQQGAFTLADCNHFKVDIEAVYIRKDYTTIYVSEREK